MSEVLQTTALDRARWVYKSVSENLHTVDLFDEMTDYDKDDLQCLLNGVFVARAAGNKRHLKAFGKSLAESLERICEQIVVAKITGVERDDEDASC